ncbi:bZIP transcription factor 12-like isoform X2 [Aristolochia californica]|uniref:bZIP transcription factor 12-like isoform X2 n=1 Tax=Aristolochia californica TaxID=171875 RepID=UPI0035DC5C0A
MASSKIMPSSNSDLNPYSSSSSIYSPPLPGPTAATPTMDDLLRTIYPTNPTAQIIPHDTDGIKPKTVDEVWKEISERKMGIGGGGEAGVGFEEMTLEDFLAKEGAVRDEDVRVSSVSQQFGVNLGNNGYQQPQQQMENSNLGFLNGNEGGGGGGVGRGKRRIVQEPVVDRAAQQRQRRMIKNRESAARSRERKQAYTVELESLVTRLEEENAQLVKQERERSRKRLRELMETLIPVDEKRRPPRRLRRTCSVEW